MYSLMVPLKLYYNDPPPRPNPILIIEAPIVNAVNGPSRLQDSIYGPENAGPATHLLSSLGTNEPPQMAIIYPTTEWLQIVFPYGPSLFILYNTARNLAYDTTIVPGKVYLFIYIYICMYVCMYVYIHTRMYMYYS